MKQTRTQINTEISTYVYTNTTGLIKGDTVRDRMLNIAESFLNILTDADQPNGYVSINAIGLANTSSIKSGTPTGLFLRDDGTWNTLGATWGGITGLINNQTDLVALVNTRLALSDVDTDVALTANSDSKVASQKAVKTYIGNQLTSYQPLIAAGTNSQYWRGDKTWQTLALGTVLGISNTTAGNNIVLSGTDMIVDSSITTSFLDLNLQRLYFFDGTNKFAVQADLSSGLIELNARDMVSITLEHSYVQTLVNGVNIGAYSQSSGNETKLTFNTTTSEISSTYSTYAGLTYNADYSANYTNRSLVDKGYVASYVTGGFVPYTGATGALTMGANNIYFAANSGIDTTATGGSDVLNIGATNAEVINYGNAATIHNFLGTAIYELQVNSYVTDKLITLNYGGALASGIGVGFEIEENSVITGYFKTNAARSGFTILSPAIAYYSDLSLASLTANRTHTLPDIDGTLASQANNLSVFAATTSAQLAGVISDEVGTGFLVFNDSPNFTTNITTPLIIGGTAVGSGITYKSTTGIGTASGDAHVFVGGNNGATSLFSLLNDGTATFYNTINLGASATNGIISWGGTTTILRSGASYVNMTIGTPAYTTNIVSYNATGNVAIGGVADNATDQLQVSNHIGTPVLNLRGRSGAAPTQLNFIPLDATNSIITFKTTGGTTRGFIDLNISSGEMKFWGAAGGYFPTFGSNNTEAARINTSQDFGIGTGSTISARLHVIKTSEQLRVGYDTSNYISTTVASTGEITNTLVGTTKTFNISSSGSTVIKVNSSAVITYIGTDGGGGYTGTSSAHAFRVYSANVQRLSFAGSGNGDCTVTDALNFILGSTTGHKFGTATTQKLSFWNATPIVQPTTAVTAATLVGGGGTTLTDTDTFDGYTLKQIVKALRNTGLLA